MGRPLVVVDASALVDVLFPNEIGIRIAAWLGERSPHLIAPDHIDLEVASATRRAEGQGIIDERRTTEMLADLRAFNLERHKYSRFLQAAWALRHNFSIYDALYVALAQAAEAPLLTTDGKLARAARELAGVDVVERFAA